MAGKRKKPGHTINFREIRTSANMTQREVSIALSVAESTVETWDQGRQPSTPYLPEIAKLFGCSIEELYGLPRPK